MKKILSLAMILLMIAFTFAGCAKAKDAAEEAVSKAIEAAKSGESMESAAQEAVQSIQKKSDFEPATSCRLQNARFMRFFGVFTQK